MIIGIMGQKFNGKDTIADYICKTYHFKKLAFATVLKSVCTLIYNLSHTQLNSNDKETVDLRYNKSPRQIMQDIGQKLKELDPDIWINHLNEERKKTSKNIVISDVRFQNEVDYINKNGGIIIKVINPRIFSNDTNISETELLSNINYNVLVINDSSKQELYYKLDTIMI